MTRWGSDWQSVGKFKICNPHNYIGTDWPVIRFLEWSPDINAQDTIYSLDEDTHFLNTNGELLSEEEEEKWNTILEENNQ